MLLEVIHDDKDEGEYQSNLRREREREKKACIQKGLKAFFIVISIIIITQLEVKIKIEILLFFFFFNIK